ncbi:LysR family transcriptional regulator [Sulfobacillus harzensis]|nr:LysR family transcriptional regulator [Sulfobacillus harzensis]
MVSLPQLRILVAIAEYGSLSQAAFHLDMTQPAVSRQVQLLEEHVGQRIFDRDAKGTRVRPEAMVLVERARRIVAEVEAFADDLDREMVQGEIKMGIVPTASAHRFPDLYRGLVQRYPGLKIDVHEMYTAQLVEGVRRGSLDLALGSLPMAATDVGISRLWKEELLAIFPANEEKPVQAAEFRDLAARPFVGFAVGHGLSRRVLELFHSQDLQPDVRYEARGIATVIGFVAAGLGVSVVPAPMARIYQQAGLVHAAPLVPRAYREMILIYSPNHLLRRAVRAAVRFMESASQRPV